MNIDRVEPGLRPAAVCVGAGDSPAHGIPSFKPVTLEDRWILSRFNRVAANVNDALATYRFHEAANSIYDFFWGEFCDWYLELIKPRLASSVGDEAKQACAVLVAVFDGALRLLHPVMPFITEEIWQTMYQGAPPLKSIAFAPFPVADDTLVDLPAETQMAVLQDLIISIRNIRTELKVDTKTRIPVEIFVHDPETGISVMQNEEAIRRLANVSSITSVEEWKARQSPSRSTARFDVHLIYEKRVDTEAERERVKLEFHRFIAEKERLEKQLDNEGFLSKAPPKVIDATKSRVNELDVLIGKHRAVLLDQLGTTTAKIHHYIPQFYLEGFLDPGQIAKGQNLLWVYESGKAPRLSPTRKAASEIDFYSFEDAGEVKKTTEAVLSRLESYTAPVLRRIISRNFHLSDLERSEFAGFVALTFCRTPFFLRSIDKIAVDFQRHLGKVMASSPGVFERALRIIELSERKKADVTADSLREFVLSDKYTITQRSKAWTLKTMFELSLELLEIIEKMRWSWLLSEDEMFVTSDEPIALFDRTAGSLYGPGFMSSKSAEFTFPLSRSLCLYCSWAGTEGAARVNAYFARQINRRTISWATRYVYAPERSEKLEGVVNDLLGKQQG